MLATAPPATNGMATADPPGALVTFSEAEVILLASVIATYTAQELAAAPTAQRLQQEVLYEMRRRNLDAGTFTIALATRAHRALLAAHQAEQARPAKGRRR